MVLKNNKPWYHGSPRKLTTLQAGSTVTQRLDIAKIFSHKPAVVIGDGSESGWRHTGPFTKGFVYLLAEPVNENDVEAVPNSCMLPGHEWNTRREFELQLFAETTVNPEELLTKRELKAMVERGEIDKSVIETIFEKQCLPE